MPPASDTTSGRLATANRARISEAVIPAVRAANRSLGRCSFTRRAQSVAGPARTRHILQRSVLMAGPNAWIDPFECNRIGRTFGPSS